MRSRHPGRGVQTQMTDGERWEHSGKAGKVGKAAKVASHPFPAFPALPVWAGALGRELHWLD
jgi:hypothetical protein